MERWRLARLTLSSSFLCCTGSKRHGRQVKEIEMLVSSQKMPLSNDITSSIPFSFYFFPSILLCVCVCLFIHRRIVSFRDDGKGPFLFLLCRLFAAVFERLKISPIRSLRSFTMFWVLYSIRGRKPVNELLCLSLLSQLYRSVSGIRKMILTFQRREECHKVLGF